MCEQVADMRCRFRSSHGEWGGTLRIQKQIWLDENFDERLKCSVMSFQFWMLISSNWEFRQRLGPYQFIDVCEANLFVFKRKKIPTCFSGTLKPVIVWCVFGAFVSRICLWWFWAVRNAVQQATCWPVTLTGYAVRGNKSSWCASGHWEPELSHALFKVLPRGTTALMVSMRMYPIAELWSVHLALQHLWLPASWQRTWLRLLTAQSQEKTFRCEGLLWLLWVESNSGRLFCSEAVVFHCF